MNHSNEPFDESLLSAYLDNELSDAERLLVETKLASEPSMRQLLSELADVRTWVTGTIRETTTVTKRNGPWNASNLDPSGLPTQLPMPSPTPMPQTPQNVPWMWKNARWVASLAALILVLLTTGYLWNGRGIDRQNRISKSTGPLGEGSPDFDAPKEDFDAPKELKNSSDQRSISPAPTDPVQRSAAPMAAEPLSAGASDEPFPALRQNVTLNLQDKLLQELGNDQALSDAIQKALEPGWSTSLQSSAQAIAFQSNMQQALQDFIPMQPAQASSALVDNPPNETEVGAIVIELFIPKDNWEEGAKRLIQLGIPVSIQLPSTELLEYNFLSPSMKESNPSDSKDLRQENPSLSFEFRSPSEKKTPASDRDSNLNSEAIVAETTEPIALATEVLATKAQAREVVLVWQYRSRVAIADAERSMAKQTQDQIGSFIRIRLHVHK